MMTYKIITNIFEMSKTPYVENIVSKTINFGSRMEVSFNNLCLKRIRTEETHKIMFEKEKTQQSYISNCC